MSEQPWAGVAQRWSELFGEHAATVQKEWLSGQSQLAAALSGTTNADPVKNAEALEQWWRSSAAMWTPMTPMTGTPSVAAESVAGLTDPLSLSFTGASQVSELLRRLSHGPRLADAGGPERATAKAMELWLAVQESARAYESVMAAAWAETNTRFAQSVSQRYQASKEAPSAKDALRDWLDIANQVLLETQRSQKFLDAQRQLLRDGMNFMLNQREMLEGIVEPAGLPTRSEIDEVHRSVYELKRRVKTLEKQLAAAATAAATARVTTTSKGRSE